MAARMNNQYEERLGTERMLPLIFKMALPAVAAQFVNLLYNIVDRFISVIYRKSGQMHWQE